MDAEELLKNIQAALEDDDDEDMAILLFQQAELTRSLLAIDCPIQHGGSRPGKRANVDRERASGHARIYKDYFSDTPTYNDVLFRRRFRMPKELFLKIMEAVRNCDQFFVEKCDATGLPGLSTVQKVVAALRMLAYGVGADATDEYCRIGESTAMKSLKLFAKAIRVKFEATYLRQPNREEIAKQMDINKERGFPGMFGRLDCMHYDWKNCPVALQGQFNDKDGNRSIILEAIVDQSLHIWHAFFGLAGSNNDLNVLERSPLVRNLLTSPAENMSFVVNGTEYPRYYLLTDGIYPKWAIFQQSIHMPHGEKRSPYAKMQESARKDVERAFGVLQGRFVVIANPSKLWQMTDISDILICCVVLHNMILEDEADEDLEPLYNSEQEVPVRRCLTPIDLLFDSEEIEDISAHFTLRNDLIEHLWQFKGDRQV